jgi:hypothetical protein
MAGAPAGFADLMNRKYDILQQTASSEAALRGAQGQGILGALPSENAQRQAQAFATTQQGKSVMPLADASIASTYAGIPTQTAQAGLLGAQSRLAGTQADDLAFGNAASSPFSRLNYLNQISTNNGFGLGSGEAPINYGSGARSADRVDPNDPRNKIRTTVAGYAAGTSNVQPQGKAKGNGVKTAPQPPGAITTGGMTLHDVMAHALGSLHAAGGATTVPPVPSPGQTITSGSWEGPTPPATSATPPPVAFPVPGAPAGGRTFGKRVSAAGGATSTEDYAKGTAKVPAKGGKSGVDSIPATLAPREAVLNEGAADHMGRGAIAALNALGAAKMAAQGTPPQTPPTAHGVMAPPPRGAPKAKPAMAKGAPPAKTKVAAKAGRK